jgi:hypothetical protein
MKTSKKKYKWFEDDGKHPQPKKEPQKDETLKIFDPTKKLKP